MFCNVVPTKKKPNKSHITLFNYLNAFYRCWSQLGRQGGRQELSLDRNGCRFVSISLCFI